MCYICPSCREEIVNLNCKKTVEVDGKVSLDSFEFVDDEFEDEMVIRKEYSCPECLAIIKYVVASEGSNSKMVQISSFEEENSF